MNNAFKKSCYAVVFCAIFLNLVPTRPVHAVNVTKSAAIMGTELEMTVNVADITTVEPALAAVVTEMRRIEEMMSEWKDDSPVSLINRNAGKKPVEVPDELFKVISAAQQVSELTDGAFDISWAAMRGLWNFAPGHERVPTEDEIKDALRLIDYRNIELDPKKKTVFLKKAGMSIGLGGIAKGYAVDKAMEALYRMGIKNAIVKAGGDMRVQGASDDGPWQIGIQDPRHKERFIAKLSLTNISLSTSGDYERYFIKDGLLYHHIIDVKTGYPARGCRSVTLIAPDTMTSDALSTSVFILGPVEGMKLVEKLKGVEAVIVDADGKITTSSGMDIGLTR